MKKVLSLILALTMMFTLTFSLGIEASATSLTEEATTMNSRVREIPEGAFLYKEGLYIFEKQMNVGSLSWTVWELYSADGWCFYDLEQPENYDEEGNLLPAEQRVYAQYRTMRKNEAYVTNNIISVPVQDGYEIVSVGGNNNEAM